VEQIFTPSGAISSSVRPPGNFHPHQHHQHFASRHLPPESGTYAHAQIVSERINLTSTQTSANTHSWHTLWWTHGRPCPSTSLGPLSKKLFSSVKIRSTCVCMYVWGCAWNMYVSGSTGLLRIELGGRILLHGCSRSTAAFWDLESSSCVCVCVCVFVCVRFDCLIFPWKLSSVV